MVMERATVSKCFKKLSCKVENNRMIAGGEIR